MIDKHQQLTLDLGKPPLLDFDTFVDEGNVQIVSALRALPRVHGSKFYFIWGESGCGKSHLLQAESQLSSQLGLQSIYLEADQLKSFDPGVLEGMEQYDVVCFDDVDVLIGNKEWEDALFHLYNRLFDLKRSLVISSNASPRQLPVGLADLKSRLTAGEIYQVAVLSDEAKRQWMITAAQHRGFVISAEVVDYILQRSARDLFSLQKVVEQLDALSLIEQRLITVPFVKKVLDW